RWGGGGAWSATGWFRSHGHSNGADLVSASAGRIPSEINAVLHPAGWITGTVTSRAGRLLNGNCVLAVPAGRAYPAVFGIPGAVTRNGRYHIGHLAAGRYDVQFSICISSRYGSQWFRAKRTQGSATPVVVREGRATRHTDAKL